MIHNSTVELVTLVPEGSEVTRRRLKVYAGRKSVTYREFYAAIQAGLNPTYIFELNIDDWNAAAVELVNDQDEVVKRLLPTELICDKVKYNILRTFETTSRLIEVTVSL